MRTEAVALKSIIEPLQVICRRGHDFPRVYTDWLALSCHAFTRNEDAYMELIDRYRDNHAAKSLAILTP